MVDGPARLKLSTARQHLPPSSCAPQSRAGPSTMAPILAGILLGVTAPLLAWAREGAGSPGLSPSGGVSQCETQFMVGAQVCMDETQGGECGAACQGQVSRLLNVCQGDEQTDMGDGNPVNIQQFLQGLQQKCGGSSPGRSPSGGGGTPSMSPSGGGWN